MSGIKNLLADVYKVWLEFWAVCDLRCTAQTIKWQRIIYTERYHDIELTMNHECLFDN